MNLGKIDWRKVAFSNNETELNDIAQPNKGSSSLCVYDETGAGNYKRKKNYSTAKSEKTVPKQKKQKQERKNQKQEKIKQTQYILDNLPSLSDELDDELDDDPLFSIMENRVQSSNNFIVNHTGDLTHSINQYTPLKKNKKIIESIPMDQSIGANSYKHTYIDSNLQISRPNSHPKTNSESDSDYESEYKQPNPSSPSISSHQPLPDDFLFQQEYDDGETQLSPDNSQSKFNEENNKLKSTATKSNNLTRFNSNVINLVDEEDDNITNNNNNNNKPILIKNIKNTIKRISKIETEKKLEKQRLSDTNIDTLIKAITSHITTQSQEQSTSNFFETLPCYFLFKPLFCSISSLSFINKEFNSIQSLNNHYKKQSELISKSTYNNSDHFSSDESLCECRRICCFSMNTPWSYISSLIDTINSLYKSNKKFHQQIINDLDPNLCSVFECPHLSGSIRLEYILKQFITVHKKIPNDIKPLIGLYKTSNDIKSKIKQFFDTTDNVPKTFNIFIPVLLNPICSNIDQVYSLDNQTQKHSNHFTSFCVRITKDLKSNVYYYDSLPTLYSPHLVDIYEKHIKTFVQSCLNIPSYTFHKISTGHQSNSHDCGWFQCLYLYLLSHDSYNPESISRFPIDSSFMIGFKQIIYGYFQKQNIPLPS